MADGGAAVVLARRRADARAAAARAVDAILLDPGRLAAMAAASARLARPDAARDVARAVLAAAAGHAAHRVRTPFVHSRGRRLKFRLRPVVDTRRSAHVRRTPQPPSGDAASRMVELLVVVLIIGILAMIALPAFLTQRAKGEDLDAQRHDPDRRDGARDATAPTNDTFTRHRRRARQGSSRRSREARDLVVVGDRDHVLGDRDLELPARSSPTPARPGAPTERTCTRHGFGGCRISPDNAGNWW